MMDEDTPMDEKMAAAVAALPDPAEHPDQSFFDWEQDSPREVNKPPPIQPEDEYDPHWWYGGIAPCKEDLSEMLQSGTYRLQSGWDPCDDDEDDMSGDEQDDSPAGGPECKLLRPRGGSRGHEARICDMLPPIEVRVGMRANCIGGELESATGPTPRPRHGRMPWAAASS